MEADGPDWEARQRWRRVLLVAGIVLLFVALSDPPQPADAYTDDVVDDGGPAASAAAVRAAPALHSLRVKCSQALARGRCDLCR